MNPEANEEYMAATPRPNAKRLLQVLLLTLNIFMAIVVPGDVLMYLVNPDTYPIGTEGMGWAYHSRTNFIIHGLIWTPLFLAALRLGMKSKNDALSIGVLAATPALMFLTSQLG